jgi:hypothetical protein
VISFFWGTCVQSRVDSRDHTHGVFKLWPSVLHLLSFYYLTYYITYTIQPAFTATVLLHNLRRVGTRK